MTRNHLRIDQLRPGQIRARLADCPRVFIPLGTIEWHCEHLPVGLDALTAEGLCLDAAEDIGGLVLPVLHYGTGGGHGAYPWTIMMPSQDTIAAQLVFTLQRLEAFGLREAVLFTGHFAPEQKQMIDRIALDWNAEQSSLAALALSVDGGEAIPLAPDHAGRFETTLLAAYHPETVDLSALPARSGTNAPEDPFGEARHATDHPLWGVFGPDPRDFSMIEAGPLRSAMRGWLTAKVADWSARLRAERDLVRG